MSSSSSRWTPRGRFVPINNEWNNLYSVHIENPPYRAARESWPFRERIVARPYGLTSFPAQPQNTMPGVIHNNAATEAYFKLAMEEQTSASKKLKKEIYNPPLRRMSRRLNLYYRDMAQNSLNEKDFIDEGGHRCAICLEDFDTRQEVMVTPCKHMFHEDCIMPWVSSNNRCPVCRKYVET